MTTRASGDYGHLYPVQYINTPPFCAPSPDFDGDGDVDVSDFVEGFRPKFDALECDIQDFVNHFLPAFQSEVGN